jgi:thiamine monophosphate kinase
LKAQSGWFQGLWQVRRHTLETWQSVEVEYDLEIKDFASMTSAVKQLVNSVHRKHSILVQHLINAHACIDISDGLLYAVALLPT